MNGAEGEVDAGLGDALRFGQLVPPVVLGGALHQQQATVGEVEGLFERFIAAVLQVEAAGGSEAEGGDRRVLPQFWLVVAMPAHAVLAIAVEVEQDAIEGKLGGGFELGFDGCQGIGPGQWFPGETGVGVAGIGVAVPGGEAGLGQNLAKHFDAALFPMDGGFELLQQVIGLSRCEEVWDELDVGVGQGEHR